MRCPFRFRRFPEAVLRCMSDAVWIQVPTICTASGDSAHHAGAASRIAGLPGFFYCSFDTRHTRRGAPLVCK